MTIIATLKTCTQAQACQGFMGVTIALAGLGCLFAVYGMLGCCDRKQERSLSILAPAILTELLLSLQLLIAFFLDYADFGNAPFAAYWISIQTAIGFVLCFSLGSFFRLLFLPEQPWIYQLLLLAGFISYIGSVIPMFLSLARTFDQGVVVYFGMVSFAILVFLLTGMILSSNMRQALIRKERVDESLIRSMNSLRFCLFLTLLTYLTASVLLLVEGLGTSMGDFFILYLFFMLSPMILSLEMIVFAIDASEAHSIIDDSFPPSHIVFRQGV